MKRLNLVGLLLSIFAVLILAGCATPMLKSSSRDTSWYGKSGALSAPVKDVNTTEETSNPTATAGKEGSWWMPEKAPRGKSDTVWGNRGYVYLDGKAPKKMPAEKASLQDIYFLFDSAELTPTAKKILNANVKVLKANPKAKMILMGYASPEGSTEYNKKLSGRRALSVKNYMIKNGVPEDSIAITSEGEMDVSVANYPSARKVHYKIISR